MDGKHFPMSEYAPGLTAPPFHPWCRSVTVPYFADNFGGMRAAKDENGNTYYVPDDMTYNKWEKQFVKSENELKTDGKSDIISSVFKSNSDLVHPITNESIENVSKIDVPGLSDEANQLIYEQRKELLVEMQKQPIGTEGSVTINLGDLTASEVNIGAFGETKIDEVDDLYFAIHNHPDNGVLSPSDLKSFCNRVNMYGLESVNNDGLHSSIIVKTFDSNPVEYVDFIDTEVKSFKNEHPNIDIEKDFNILNEFCKNLFKEGVNYGYKIIER